MRNLLFVSFMLIICIIGNSSGKESTDVKGSTDSTGTKSDDSGGPKSGDPAGLPSSSDNNCSTKTADCNYPGTSGDKATLETPLDEKFEKIENSREELETIHILDRMSPDVATVEDNLVPECVNDKDGNHHEHDDSKCTCTKNDKPTTSDSKEDKKVKEESISMSPNPRSIRNGNGLAFKYEVNFKKPLFNIKGFRGGLSVGYIKSGWSKSGSKDLGDTTEHTPSTFKIFMLAEFGLIKNDNTTLGLKGELFLEVTHGNGEFKIELGGKMTIPGREIFINKNIGNTMKESPPFCVRIPQLAGIQFCQVAFDLVFRTNFTGSACIQTEMKHILCPIALVTIQYHCINFNRAKFYVTKTTRRTGVVHPKEVVGHFTRKIPSAKNQAKSSSSTSSKSPSTKYNDKARDVSPTKSSTSKKSSTGTSPTKSSTGTSPTKSSTGTSPSKSSTSPTKKSTSPPTRSSTSSSTSRNTNGYSRSNR